MARKSRSPRSGATAARTRKKRTKTAARKRAATTPNMVETAMAAFAHEVRTPLTGILAVSDLLAPSGLEPRERRWVDTIKAGAEHLAALATLFVDAARSRNAGLGARQDFFDLRTRRMAGDRDAQKLVARGPCQFARALRRHLAHRGREH